MSVYLKYTSWRENNITLKTSNQVEKRNSVGGKFEEKGPAAVAKAEAKEYLLSV